MLKGLTSTFRNNSNALEVDFEEYIIINGNTIPVKAKLSDDCYENGNFIGSFIFKTIQFETSNDIDFKKKEFEYYKVVNNESIKIGTFITTELEDNDTNELVKVVAMDYGLKTQIEYKSTLDYSSGNVTLLDVWNEACELSGIESGVQEFTNSNFIVDSDQFSGTGATIRDVFKGIGISSGSFIKVMNDDKIYPIFKTHTGELLTNTINNTGTIENVSEIDKIQELKGNTFQQTYTGKNLLDYPYSNRTITTNGITFTDNGDGTITANGTATNIAMFYIKDSSSIFRETALNKNIILSGCPAGGGATTYRIQLWNFNANNGFKYDNGSGTGAFTFTNSDANYNMVIRVYTGTTLNNAVFKPMVRLSSITDDNYEPYVGGVPSPNPDYPQPIENVTGLQNVIISNENNTKSKSYEINLGKNLLNILDGTYINNGVIANVSGGEIILNGTASDTAFIRINLGKKLNWINGKNYTISAFNEEANDNIRLRINDNGQLDTQLTSINTNNNIMYSGETGMLSYEIVIRVQSGTTLNNFKLKPMIEKGSQATSYSPYFTPIELNKIGNYQDSIKKSTGKNLIEKITTQVTYVCPCKVGDKFTFSFIGKGTVNDKRVFLRTYDGAFSSTLDSYVDNETITLTSSNTNYSRTITSTIDGFIYIRTASNYTTYTLSNIQLEKGSTATSYEPYGTGWYIEKNIGKVVLNGTENWQDRPNFNDCDRFVWNTTIIPTQPISGLSNYFIVTNSSYNVSTIGYLRTSQGDQVIINFSEKGTTTLSQFKTWLGTHNTDVYYVLSIPTYEVITNKELINQLESIRLLKGTNNISITSENLTGELKLTYWNDNSEIVEDYTDLEDKRDTRPISCVRLGMSQVDGENVDLIDEELVEEYGENWLILNDNPFAYNQSKRQELITAIFNKVKGFGYSSFVSKTSFKPYLTCGDLIKFKNRNGDLIDTILLRYTHENSENDVQIQLEAPSETNATVNYVYPLSAIDINKRTQVEVDKDKVQIKNLTNQTNRMQSDLSNNYYTLEQTNELIQTAQNGLTNTFSEAGGNNIFRNTGLWFTQNDQNNPYEFWNGKVERVKEEEASNYSALSLQLGTLSQEQLVSNGKYTISFKYKKASPLVEVKCFINDIEYILDTTNEQEFIETVEVNSQHINIAFECNSNDGCEIYDLMVNAGSVKLAYSQNQNEITTDTVNIGKGITITSSEMDTTFKADADGIRVYDNKNMSSPKTKFTDKGTETDYIKVNNEAEIVEIYFQKVGNHTWLTKI